MSAHTPGPWVVCDAPPNDCWFAGRTIGAADPRDARRVCDVFSFYTPPEPGSMAEANARLIAAAPDMLAALQALSDSLPSDEYMRAQGQEPGPGLVMMRAAIAKAKGDAT